MKRTRFLFILTIIMLPIYFSTFSSCSKEYSCEGCLVRDTIPPRDTTVIKDTTRIDSTIKFSFCSTCETTQLYILNKWSFKNYKSNVCGNILYAKIEPGEDLTFRGFQDCTGETQFVVTGVFPPNTFDADRLNVVATYSNFLLYAPNNVILAVTLGTPLTMNAVLDTFNYSTGIASFRFYGYAYTNKGGSSYITGDSSYVDGRVRAKVR